MARVPVQAAAEITSKSAIWSAPDAEPDRRMTSSTGARDGQNRASDRSKHIELGEQPRIESLTER